jgi:protein-disulfide isomerase
MKIYWIIFGIGSVFFGLGFLLLSFANPIANYLSKKPEITVTQKISKEPVINIKQDNTFVLYHDFTCPYCNKFYENVYIPLSKKYSDQINFSIIPYFSNKEGKSFEMTKRFYCINNQKINTEIYLKKIKQETTNEEITKILPKLNFEEFKNCLSNKKTDEYIINIKNQAKEKGVNGTPTFFINNIKFEKNQPIEKVELILLNTVSK